MSSWPRSFSLTAAATPPKPAPTIATDTFRAICATLPLRVGGQLKGKAGPDGIEVEHKGIGHGDWLLDFWLAERVAGAV